MLRTGSAGLDEADVLDASLDPEPVSPLTVPPGVPEAPLLCDARLDNALEALRPLTADCND